MLPWSPSLWTEEYLLNLVGSPESATLEFKSGRAVAKKADRERFIRDQLSPAVSAFANSDGGVIIIGMEEEKSKGMRVAKAPDGVLIAQGEAFESVEQLQQLVDECISPYLAGVRVKHVPLSAHLAGRSALAVYVPQGVTAYQAKDHRYYSRSEFETKSLPDHEVRLRMMRGRSARVGLDVIYDVPSREHIMQHLRALRDLSSMKTDEKHEISLSEAFWELIKNRGLGDQKVAFRLKLRNTGELTVRDVTLQVCIACGPCAIVTFNGAVYSGVVDDKGHKFRLQREVQASAGQYGDVAPRIFPGDDTDFPEGHWTIVTSHGKSIDNSAVSLQWRAFLDDATPSEGVVDVLQKYREHIQDLTREV